MTLILAGKTKSGSVYMAGDRYEGDDFYFQKCVASKISIKNKETNPILIGCAGDSWGCTLLVDLIKWPELKPNENELIYIKDKMVIEVRKNFKHLGVEKLEGENQVDVRALAVLNKKIFHFQVLNMSLINVYECENIGAVGAGSTEGIASLKALLKSDSKMSFKQKMLLSMEVTASMNNVVNPPFDILKV